MHAVSFVFAEFLGWLEIIRQELVFVTGEEDLPLLGSLLEGIKFQLTGETPVQGELSHHCRVLLMLRSPRQHGSQRTSAKTLQGSCHRGHTASSMGGRVHITLHACAALCLCHPGTAPRGKEDDPEFEAQSKIFQLYAGGRSHATISFCLP
jgi:hypothetical protein